MTRTHRHVAALVGLLLATASVPASADPIAAIVGLFTADKITAKETNQPVRANWRDSLRSKEQQALETLAEHPAIEACIDAADRGHAIAGYNLRKMAGFLLELERQAAADQPVTRLDSLNHRWAAKAFQWCSRESGLLTADPSRPLIDYARGLVRAAGYAESGTGILTHNTRHDPAL